jgi:hypothetical protein
MCPQGDLTPESLYQSAMGYARRALEVYNSGEPHRVAVDAGTALELLAKACLASRSPALLVELRQESDWHSLLKLLGYPEGKPKPLRTVSLRVALKRVTTFVPSRASTEALANLIDLRDGAIHIGASTEVEERLLVAFVQRADSLLADLSRDRESFWGGQLAVVDTILEEASSKVSHRVAVKMQVAKARFERDYNDLPIKLRADVISTRETGIVRLDEAAMECPACDSRGLASGEVTVEWGTEDVWFSAHRFICPICGLRLDSMEEIDQVTDPVWEIDEDPYLYDEPPSVD